MNITRAREIMRDAGIRYLKSYKFDHRNGFLEIVFKSTKTGKKCIVCDREDIGGYTGAQLRNI